MSEQSIPQLKVNAQNKNDINYDDYDYIELPEMNNNDDTTNVFFVDVAEKHIMKILLANKIEPLKYKKDFRVYDKTGYTLDYILIRKADMYNFTKVMSTIVAICKELGYAEYKQHKNVIFKAFVTEAYGA